MKKILWVLTPVLVILFGVGWIFPYSFLSMNKSILYKPDKVFVNDYIKELRDLESDYNFKKSSNPTISTISEVDKMLNEKWLTQKKSIKISKTDINREISQIKNVKNDLVLLERNNKANYKKETLNYLYLLIDDCDSIADQYSKIKNSNLKTRFTIQREFGNLHMTYSEYLKKTRSFLESYKSSP
ncbi:hypothetical protein WD019_21265 [Fictibacillus sp. Mic-4]|uniref:hypothetical protein n=1 Tax=Fictibacillus sp. Mic-4 TaxID=3132826 RepID=UPI003CF2ADE9